MSPIEALRRLISAQVMPTTAVEYDLLIGGAINQAVRENRSLESFNQRPRYFAGLVIIHRPIVPQPIPCRGWAPTAAILLVWRGLGGYSPMTRNDLHFAKRKPLEVKPDYVRLVNEWQQERHKNRGDIFAFAAKPAYFTGLLLYIAPPGAPGAMFRWQGTQGYVRLPNAPGM